MINLNGNIIPSTEPVFLIENRAFKYGDSLFETIRMFEGEMPFLKLHFDRLKEGVHLLGMIMPDDFNITFFKKEIHKLIQGKENARIRFTVFRNDGGLYTPKENNFQFLVEKTPLKSSNFELNKKGLRLGITKEKLITSHPYSHLKTGNSLPYILAAIEKNKYGFDDILIQNQKGHIAEAISSNLFIIIKNRIYTPPLSSGCIGGTIRKFLLENYNGRIKEKEITLEVLEKADGIFLTNTIQGIRWVKSVNNVEYGMREIVDGYVDVLNMEVQLL